MPPAWDSGKRKDCHFTIERPTICQLLSTNQPPIPLSLLRQSAVSLADNNPQPSAANHILDLLGSEHQNALVARQPRRTPLDNPLVDEYIPQRERRLDLRDNLGVVRSRGERGNLQLDIDARLGR